MLMYDNVLFTEVKAGGLYYVKMYAGLDPLGKDLRPMYLMCKVVEKKNQDEIIIEILNAIRGFAILAVKSEDICIRIATCAVGFGDKSYE